MSSEAPLNPLVSRKSREAQDELCELPTIAESNSPHIRAGHPPSFAESQFDVILRRQRARRVNSGALKFTDSPSRFLNLSNDFEFAGWGTVTYTELSADDLRGGELTIQNDHGHPILGEWMASAVAANDVLGSVFYALPTLVSVAGVYSPISLFVATLTIFLWRPIFEELASALPITGANYTYLLNVSSKSFALAAAALALLDYVTTAVISAATASAYISGEVSLPFPVFVGTILLAALPVGISLCGLRESARTAFAILSLHGLTMTILCVTTLVAWMRAGNSQLHDNWISAQPGSASAVARQVFNGICIGMLGLTGFECCPDYASTVKRGKYPNVLRNIHWPAILLNAPLMLLILAVLPMPTINGGANVLSLLAEKAGGRWLRIWVVVDAVVVLSAGVLTGILSACALLERLAHDRAVPQIFAKRMPLTGSHAVAIFAFTVLCGVLYASAGANAVIISKMFTLTWLSVMALFPVSVLLLKFNRWRLPRTNRASLGVVVAALILSCVVFAGNVALDPTTVGYFAAYATALLVSFHAAHNRVRLLRWVYWAYDQTPFLHTIRFVARHADSLVAVFRRMRRHGVVVFTKSDEIHQLFRVVTYVHENEETACLKLVHFYANVDEIPSELEANAKLLDEAFPNITIDLIFVQASFTPVVVASLSHRLNIPRSLMFMTCPGTHFPMDAGEFGTRIISL
ncbi:hypothetical protein BD410DRAFT_893978 [Rickenella mellea]|uniref:AAAP amino acid permease n=1 Tax=Rickenella mellea TaxID=50990 RepID=A0A4Y7QJH5_9AGAM|nr:hypothetical protein BD410DRAFT_893978 [Rickenella mellea]